MFVVEVGADDLRIESIIDKKRKWQCGCSKKKQRKYKIFTDIQSFMDTNCKQVVTWKDVKSSIWNQAGRYLIIYVAQTGVRVQT